MSIIHWAEKKSGGLPNYGWLLLGLGRTYRCYNRSFSSRVTLGRIDCCDYPSQPLS